MKITAPSPDAALPARFDLDRPQPACFSAPETCNPDEYRWMPVERRARRDGWSEEKQRRFIAVLAATGLVSEAAKDVGMTARSAYKLRRSAHAAGFTRAWDAALDRAGAVLEDAAFERVLEGSEHNVYNGSDEVACTRRAYDNRLLTFLLRNFKPERYASDVLTAPVQPPQPLDASLRDMEQAFQVKT